MRAVSASEAGSCRWQTRVHRLSRPMQDFFAALADHLPRRNLPEIFDVVSESAARLRWLSRYSPGGLQAPSVLVARRDNRVLTREPSSTHPPRPGSSPSRYE